jgi:hypothetical protein
MRRISHRLIITFKTGNKTGKIITVSFQNLHEMTYFSSISKIVFDKFEKWMSPLIIEGKDRTVSSTG